MSASNVDRDVSGTPSSVFLVSGGARGITAQCVIKLAQRYPCRFVLVGRSPYDGGQEPAWATDVGREQTESALKSRAIAHLKALGERPTPKRVQRMVKDVLAQREIAGTLQAIEDAGGRAVYVSADVTDETALRAGVEDAVVRLGAPITGVIHGAGVLADKLIEDKTLADFESVYGVKVRGLENLLQCVSPEKLTHLILFSSVAGFYGNVGQADYAIANEVLNKVAHAVKRVHPSCHVLAVDWGPWDGGMVSPALKEKFEQLGIDVIPVAQGTEILADLVTSVSPFAAAGLPTLEALALERGHPVRLAEACPRASHPFAEGLPTEARPVQVVVGGLGSPSGHGFGTSIAALSPGSNGDGSSPRTHRLHRRLTLEANPFLRDHVIGGRAVLPIVCAAAWIANVCEQCYPGYHFFRMAQYKALKGIVFDETLAEDYILDLTEVSNAPVPGDAINGDQICLDALVWSRGPRGPDDPTRPDGMCPRHYSACVTLRRSDGSRDLPSYPRGGLRGSEAIILGDALYQDKKLFHGPSFRGVQRVLEITREGLTMECLLPDVPLAKQGQFPVQAFNPYMTDVQLQSLLIWSAHFYGMPGLPLRIQRAEHFRTAPFGETVYAALQVQSDNARSLVADVTAFNAQGDVYMRVSGAEITLSERLNELFQRNYL